MTSESSGPSSVDLEALEANVRDAHLTVESEIEAVESQIDEQMNKPRQWMGYAVVATWVLGVLGTLVWLMLSHPSSVCTESGDQKVCVDGWSAAKDDLSSLLAVAVLPVVTLVLGYYFGRREESA